MSDTNGRAINSDRPTSDEALRRMMARDALEDGRLPRRPADRTWGGAGAGENCAICGLQISPQDQGIELEFTGVGRKPATHILHVPCFTAWEAECRSGESPGKASDQDEKTPGNGQLNRQRQ